MKKVYICGDSFGSPLEGWEFDPWPKLLSILLGNTYDVTNLSICCASNLLIRIQVDRAILNQADFVILLGTACTRSHGHVRTINNPATDIYERFVRVGDNNDDSSVRDLACYSLRSLDHTCVFNDDDIRSIKDYQSRLFDLDLAIYENQCIIESSLYSLEKNNIPFIFDQGGFENPVFGDVRRTDYFSNFDAYKSEINQWTLSNYSSSGIGHYHITDPAIHQQIANYYYKKIISS